MPFAKITLSEAEMTQLISTDWILTKQNLTAKISQLLSNQVQLINAAFGDFGRKFGDERLLKATPKISKGENYKGLPWMVLDYPSVFDKENRFALRTIMWWANFVSINLHLSGLYKLHLQERILRNLPYEENEWFVCVHKSEWQHHFGEDNYVPVYKAGIQHILDTPFLKLALRFDLKDWDQLPENLAEGYNKTAGLLKEN